MMDSPEYCEKALRKIEFYIKNEIFLGENLIITYETNAMPLNTKIVESLIYKHLN